jgi:hypothetical protein
MPRACSRSGHRGIRRLRRTPRRRFDALAAAQDIPPLRSLLPEVLSAGADAGALTSEGAALLDPTGKLHPGIPFCPPEGDAGTGMVATGAVAPRTGNVSAGTSIFAMVVLERPLAATHHELDLVTTPAGDPVAMVHCNNGASELAAWAGLFARFAAASGTPLDDDTVFDVLFREALTGDADAGGLLAYNHLAGSRSPDSRRVARCSCARRRASRSRTHARTALRGVRHPGARHAVLDREGVGLDRMYAHGGMFRTAGVAQRFLAGALDAPSPSARPPAKAERGELRSSRRSAPPSRRGPPPTSAAISPTSCSPTRRPRSPHPIRPTRPASPTISITGRGFRSKPPPCTTCKEHHDPVHLSRELHRLVRDRQPGPTARRRSARSPSSPAGRRGLAGLPVTVEWKPVLTDSDAIRRLALDANADDSVIGVIAWMHTFSPAKMWIAGLDALQKPLLHLHTQANVELPWAEIDFDFMNLNQAAHGDREFGYIQTRLGVARKTVVGHVSNPAVRGRSRTGSAPRPGGRPPARSSSPASATTCATSPSPRATRPRRSCASACR